MAWDQVFIVLTDFLLFVFSDNDYTSIASRVGKSLVGISRQFSENEATLQVVIAVYRFKRV